MKEQLNDLVKRASEEAKKITNESEYLNIKSKYLGKKSELNTYMSNIKNMNSDDKKLYGPLFNKLKKEFDNLFTKYYEESLNKNEIITFDPTLPVKEVDGSLHPVTIVARDVTNILKKMGFMVLDGPEMESEYFNFEALNIPATHPARDMQDTYWLDNGLLLRTHTSPVQARAMQKYGAPIKMCVPGRCFRNEDLDASHENTFFQLEGMVIDENISISNILYVMKGMLREVFKQDIEVRLRPGFFPFVEPGFELDCSCTICGGKGCPTCKDTGWIELCPCGMIHPNVFEESGIDSKVYSGFAFGLGLTRLAMMKYKINDIRYLNSSDLRHLSQFNIR
ncbi:MAG: phenylalanine--tRNA ligase subunit alpha [Bacilli bacterium]|nr:phenylalanine--tRNA ligase subunit alpha [Bacilli bacterium]MDD3895809.1 phenylalanine--tRNA ligase subunit alpha [Bacilli bacterium]MDD4407846.1 phenylalanine--tRNA ligase subunit alpha [Bacilli bacterium]